MDLKKKGINLQDIGLPRLVLIILAGIVLLVLSLPSGLFGSSGKEAETEVLSEEGSEKLASQAMEKYTSRKEKELEEILGKVKGVGSVDVMITLASSEEKITLQDGTDSSEQSGSAGESDIKQKQSFTQESVLIQQEGEEQPYLVQILSPEVEGVLVVAKGAGEGNVDTEIIEAVQALFRLESHKIRVMKME